MRGRDKRMRWLQCWFSLLFPCEFDSWRRFTKHDIAFSVRVRLIPILDHADFDLSAVWLWDVFDGELAVAISLNRFHSRHIVQRDQCALNRLVVWINDSP